MQTMAKIVIMPTISIRKIVVCFQCRHEGEIKRLGPRVGLHLCSEQELNPDIQNRIRRKLEPSIINTSWMNHDEVQSVTAVKWFCRERVTVNPLHTVVLGVSKDQTVVQCKMALAPSGFRQFQCLKYSTYLKIIAIIAITATIIIKKKGKFLKLCK